MVRAQTTKGGAQRSQSSFRQNQPTAGCPQIPPALLSYTIRSRKLNARLKSMSRRMPTSAGMLLERSVKMRARTMSAVPIIPPSRHARVSRSYDIQHRTFAQSSCALSASSAAAPPLSSFARIQGKSPLRHTLSTRVIRLHSAIAPWLQLFPSLSSLR